MLESLARLSSILAKMYEITFYHQPLARYVQRSGKNLFECKKMFQIIHIVLPTEQSIKLFFQTFCLKWLLLLICPISQLARIKQI